MGKTLGPLFKRRFFASPESVPVSKRLNSPARLYHDGIPSMFATGPRNAIYSYGQHMAIHLPYADGSIFIYPKSRQKSVRITIGCNEHIHRPNMHPRKSANEGQKTYNLGM